METRLCRLYGAHDLRLESGDVAAPGWGEVCVAVAAGGICGSDLHYYHEGGIGAIRVREPIILGHEAAGRVVAAGEGTDLAPGDIVALNPSRPCGSCTYCLRDQENHCENMEFRGSAMRMPHVQGLFRARLVLPAEQCAGARRGARGGHRS